MDVLDNKCPSCGAKIDFNPVNQMWDCMYCGSKIHVEDVFKSGKMYCIQCGSLIDGNSNFCIHCGTRLK